MVAPLGIGDHHTILCRIFPCVPPPIFFILGVAIDPTVPCKMYWIGLRAFKSPFV